MSAHDCKTLTNGCFRCDLNRDEMTAIAAEDRQDAEAAWDAYKDTAAFDAQTLFVDGFIAGRRS